MDRLGNLKRTEPTCRLLCLAFIRPGVTGPNFGELWPEAVFAEDDLQQSLFIRGEAFTVSKGSGLPAMASDVAPSVASSIAGLAASCVLVAA